MVTGDKARPLDAAIGITIKFHNTTSVPTEIIRTFFLWALNLNNGFFLVVIMSSNGIYMNHEQHAFLKLGEECNEVAMLCSKIIQFGIDSEYEGKTNRERLIEELNDIMGCLLNLEVKTDFYFSKDREATLKKYEKMERFCKISEELGFVALSTK